MTPEDKMKRARLDDIPAMLRQMADDIDKGQISPESALLILPAQESGQWPSVYGWGARLSDLELVGLCELAKSFFVVNQTERSR